MTLFWFILFIAAAALELATLAMVSIWFAVGALAAMLCSILGAGELLQLIVFALCSMVTLILFKIKGEKITRAHSVPTNADRVIGRKGRVIKAIDNGLEEGLVLVDGQEWTARAESKAGTVPEGEFVIVKRIDGVKLIVERIAKAEMPEDGMSDCGKQD